MSENGRILLKTLQLLIEEHDKPEDQRCEQTIERYRDAICSVTDRIMVEEPHEPYEVPDGVPDTISVGGGLHRLPPRTPVLRDALAIA